jgi:hypothetical protein
MVPHGFTRGIAHLPIQVRGCSSILWPRSKRKYSWSTFPAVSYSTVKSFKLRPKRYNEKIKLEISVLGRILDIKNAIRNDTRLPVS